MKKIRCEVVPHDYIQVKVNFEGVDINVVYDDSTHGVYITAAKIRKLRKQLKRALIEIEGGSSEYPEKSREHQISSSQVSGPYIGNKFFLTESDDWPVSLSNYGIEKARKKTSGKRS